MENADGSEAVISLQFLEDLVRNQYDDSMTCSLVTSSSSSFLSIWRKQTNLYETSYAMKYLPLFYIIASLDKETKLSLKLITFHGKVLEELNGFSNLMSDEDKLNFVGKLNRMKLCQGVKMPDNDLKLDASTFSAMYLVERLEQNVIIRSHQCQYGLYDDLVCKMCASLNTAYGSNNMKYEAKEDDNFYYTDGMVDPINNAYEHEGEESFGYPLEDSPMSCEKDLKDNDKQESLVEKTLRKKHQKKSKEKKTAGRMRLRKSTNASKKEHNTTTTVIKCKHCSHETNDITLLMMHNIEVHTPQFNGDFCDSESPNMMSTTLQCEECSFYTSVEKEFTDHMNTFHDLSEDFPCKLCGKLLGRKDSLKTHMNTVHKRPFKCPSCPYETAQESRLTRHIQAVHDKIKRYFCEQCSYATSDNYSLKFHIKSVHEKLKPFICEQCTYATTTRQALNNHIKAVHERLKPFLCELCSTSFSTKYLLVQHVSVIHNKVKEFKCKQCSYETARKYYLLDHIRSVHEKIKQFRCDLCSFETAVKCNLKNHILAVHEKTKPFQCQLCSFEAIRKKQLSQHMSTVHDETSQL